MGLLDRIAGQCEIRLLAAPWAPGLTLAFARWRGAAPTLSPLATGTGPGAKAAILRALGEMAENLSLVPDAWPGPIAAYDRSGRGRLCDDVRAQPQAGDGNLGSEGCAAGETVEQARFAALCERAERAALAQWWRGGLIARAMDLPACVGVYRADRRSRRDRLFVLPFLPGLTICLAISDDGAGGQLALGSAAASQPDQAADAALREAMQAEIAWLAPSHHPDVALRDHLHRGLRQRATSLQEAPPAPKADAGACLSDLLAGLAAAGVPHGFADLTHPTLAIPVWRFVCPAWPRARPLFAPAPLHRDARPALDATG